MACVYAFKNGAKRVIGIDNNWRTDYAKAKVPGLETINYLELDGKTIAAKIHEMVPGGLDACIEASGGEYRKGWVHRFELAVGMEQDTSEMVNECITSTRKFGRVGIIGDYVGCKCHPGQEKVQYLIRNSYESFQCRFTDGTRYPTYRLRTSTCSKMSFVI